MQPGRPDSQKRSTSTQWHQQQLRPSLERAIVRERFALDAFTNAARLPTIYLCSSMESFDINRDVSLGPLKRGKKVSHNVAFRRTFFPLELIFGAT